MAEKKKSKKDVKASTGKSAKKAPKKRPKPEASAKQKEKELELEKSLEAEKQKAARLKLKREKEAEERAASEQELRRKIEEEKRKARDLELQRKEETERRKARMLELQRGIEAERQCIKDLELRKREEAELFKASEIELQRGIEAEIQKVKDLEELRKEESTKLKAGVLELEKDIEAERRKVGQLAHKREELAEKYHAGEQELRKIIETERHKARELELGRKEEAIRQRTRELELKRSIEREKRRARDLERRKKKDAENWRIKELKLQRRRESEEARRIEAERRILKGVSRRKGIDIGPNAIKLLVAVIAVLFIVVFAGVLKKPAEHVRTVPLMGTFMQIKAYGNGILRRDLSKEVDEALKLARRLEKKFSIFDPESEVNKLNIDKMRVVSRELFNLINKAKRISHITGGTFDITVTPILKVNGFYKNMPVEILDKIPNDFRGVGVKNVTLRLDNSVRLRNGAWIDLSGIAKGNIVDSMTSFLREKGMNNILINAGGDMYCGIKKGNKPWLVGVREPGSERVLLKLAVKDMAVATSGDYENVVIDENTGEVLSHIIDPFREAPIKETFSSVTVIAPTCAEADALATGMMVMGKDDAIALANEMKDVSIIVVTGSDGQHSVDLSEGAEKYVTGR